VGFDYSFTMPCGIQGPLYVNYENGVWLPISDDSKLIHFTADSAKDPAYVSDKGPGTGDSSWDPRLIGPLISGKATNFIKKMADENTPFFLCYWSPMVHLPHIPPDQFDGRDVKGQTPTPHIDMILDLDQQVGRIIQALKDAGVYENTLIIFSSDNGGLYDQVGLKNGHDSSGGFRGFKNDPYEGGHRVPFFAAWPGMIKPDSDSDEPIAIHDVVATMAEVLDIPLREDQAMDSLSLVPLLHGEGEFINRQDFLLQGGSRNELIYRSGQWKMIIQSDHHMTKWDPVALFNLEDNPLEEESENLINDPAQAERVQTMHERYMQIRQSGERTTAARR